MGRRMLRSLPEAGCVWRMVDKRSLRRGEGKRWTGREKGGDALQEEESQFRFGGRERGNFGWRSWSRIQRESRSLEGEL